ncbi:MAG: DUF2600 family protein [Clostridiaceae bacterium]|nr:DUF2600 family protein [Clostridiaceae bacterium]
MEKEMVGITRYSLNPCFLLLKYIFKVLPEARKQRSYWKHVLKELMSDRDLSFLLSQCFKGRDSLIHFLYSLYPGSDIKVTVSFISSFWMLVNYLGMLCLQCRIKDEPTLRQIFLSVLDATDPKRETSNYCKYFHTKGMKKTLALFVETCRNQLLKLPAYDIVLEQVKKYVYFYVDFNTYKYISGEENPADYILTWADYYIKQFPLISPWEFSASANSLLCILALVVSASDPMLGPNTAKDVESVHFPWICTLNILLRDFLHYNKKILEGEDETTLNFAHNYRNLKECEERITFFLARSLGYPVENCSCPGIINFYKFIVKWMLSIYLSDPRARLGFNRIASQNLLKLRDMQYKPYYIICRIIGLFL